VRRLKFICDVQTGDKDTENAVEEGQYPFFVRSQTVERIHSMSFDCEAVLTAGDGVGVGKVFHYYNGPFDFHQRVYMMNNFREVSGPFLFHFLRENFFKVALEGGAKSTVDSLRRPTFMNFPVCVPPKMEQEAIVKTVEQDAIKFDALTAEAQRAIDLLQERRTALISAAVTGQIDVRSITN
jgi:type I restriction enzyme S subunit